MSPTTAARFYGIELNGATSRLLWEDCSLYRGKIGAYSGTPGDAWAGIRNFEGSRQSRIGRRILNRLIRKIILRLLFSNHCCGKWLCVVVKYSIEPPDAFVVTAYLTNKPKTGTILWQKN